MTKDVLWVEFVNVVLLMLVAVMCLWLQRCLLDSFPQKTDGLSIAVSVDIKNVLAALRTELLCFDDTQFAQPCLSPT